MALMHKVAVVAMLAFVLSSMAAMGLGLTVRHILAPLRNVRLVGLALLANFVLMPLSAVALAALLQLDPPQRVGLLLLGVAAGAPFLPHLVQRAKGNLAFAVGLMVLLMVTTVGYLPLVLPVVLPGVAVHPAQIARSLCLLMLLPLAGALALHATFPATAARAQPLLERTSTLSLLLVIVLLTVLHIPHILALFGTHALVAGLGLTALGYGVGWWLGGPAADTRLVLGLGTAQRNIAAALVVGSHRCLKNCADRWGGHRCEMHPIPQACNAPGASIDRTLPSTFVTRVGLQCMGGGMAGEHRKKVLVDCRIIFRFQTHKISRFLTLWVIKTGTFRHISFPCMP